MRLGYEFPNGPADQSRRGRLRSRVEGIGLTDERKAMMYWIRNMALNHMRLLFAHGSEPAIIKAVDAVVENHEPGAEPYDSMSREELAARFNLAYEAGDPVAYAVVEEHLLDKMSVEELRIHGVGHAVAMEIGETLKALEFSRMERVMTEAFNLLIDLDGELNAVDDCPGAAD
jgi:hypothetical protein